jgi:1,4-alpha-glucan branching enzyme
MISRARRRGTTRFSIDPPEGAREVFLAGDFTDWQPRRVRRQRNGAFALIVPLPAGEYQYKFIVDGHWEADPDHGSCATSPCGTLNSVVDVPPPRERRSSPRRNSAAGRMPRGRRRRTIRFSINPPEGAREVFLAGDFTDWQPRRVRRQRNGAFALIVLLPAGEYQYKFIVDGRWEVDPGHGSHAMSPCGTLNSVVNVSPARERRSSPRRVRAARAA